MSSRRVFMKQAGLALFAAGLGGVPGFLANTALAAKPSRLYKKGKILVFIFQRGAMDGLMAVTPFTDPFLRQARPSIFMDAVAEKGKKPLIDLDGRFGLHPSLAPMLQLYKSKQLAILHGMGSPNSTRSHFDAQDYMESGTPFHKGTASGWLNRAVGLMGHEATPFRAVSITSSLPRSFYGDQSALAISNLDDFAIQLKGNPMLAQSAAKSFEDLYDHTTNNLLNKTGKESFEAMKMLESAAAKKYVPANGAVYPNSPLGQSLKEVARLIKMDVGLEVAFAESGGWDTHFNQGTDNGSFGRNAADLANSINAFWNDIADRHDDVLLMTSTEFGRTVRQNGTGGTDHGRGSCAFILGTSVNGGMVHGKLDPLATENLADGRDLAVTTDFRSLFYDVAASHLGITDAGILFPEWKGSRSGVMKA